MARTLYPKATMLRTLPLPFLLIACGGAPAPVSQTRVDLRSALGVADAAVVGVAYDDAIYVLDDNLGLFRLDEGKGTRIATKEMLLQQAPLQSGLTDLAAVGDGRFALTAMNDGYMLDPVAPSFVQFFCYEPEFVGDRFAPTPVVQLTHAVAVDPIAGRIYAQPQTLDMNDRSKVLLSQIGVWDLANGSELAWFELDDADFVAGGMVVDSDGSLLLAKKDAIERYDLTTGTMEPAYDLSRSGVSQVDGLAIGGDGSLLIVDGADDELVVVAR